MRKITKLFSMILFLITLFTLGGCEQVYSNVAIGFKITDGAGKYDESIDAFEIGKTFYTCIDIQINTNKKRKSDYVVIIEVPKTNEVIVDQTGGIEAKSQEWNPDIQVTKLTFDIKGNKETTGEKILFSGQPIAEGKSKITVKIYDDKSNLIKSVFRVISYKYVLEG